MTHAKVEDPEGMIIQPAINGNKYILEACKKHHVKRCVLTSSMLTVIPVKTAEAKQYGPDDWIELTPDTEPYTTAKVKAEQLAWEYHNSLSDADKFELVVVKPGFIVGPLIHQDGCSS